MNMRRLMKMGAKALKLQHKRMPDKRFKDDDGQFISFSQVAGQIEAILALMYAPTNDFYVEQKGENCWLIRRKQVNSSVRNNRH